MLIARAREIFINESRYLAAQLRARPLELPHTVTEYLTEIQKALDRGSMPEVAAWATLAFEFMAIHLEDAANAQIKSTAESPPASTEGSEGAGYNMG